MKKLLVFLLVLVCVFSLVACNGNPFIVSIQQEASPPSAIQISLSECFYEDAHYRYHFPPPGSQGIVITYLNGKSETFATAFPAGRVTIDDLQRFGIKFGVELKSQNWPGPD